MSVASVEAALPAWQDTNRLLPYNTKDWQGGDGVAGELPPEPFEPTQFAFHQPSLEAAYVATNDQRQEALLAQVAMKSHFGHFLKDWWSRDPIMKDAVQRYLGSGGEAVYRDVVTHFPEISVVQHRASQVLNAARICVSGETEQPETIFTFWDNGATADAARLRSRWVKPNGQEPGRYDLAAQQLAHSVAKRFGGSIIAVSGRNRIDISDAGSTDLWVQPSKVKPIEGNLVVVRLPHPETPPRGYPVLRLVPDLAPELAEAV